MEVLRQGKYNKYSNTETCQTKETDLMVSWINSAVEVL